MKLYKKAYPHALNPNKLANSIFRLCDQNKDNVIDFKEFISSFCIPPTRCVSKNNSAIEAEVQTESELDLVTEDKISQDSGLEIEGFSSNVI